MAWDAADDGLNGRFERMLAMSEMQLAWPAAPPAQGPFDLISGRRIDA